MNRSSSRGLAAMLTVLAGLVACSTPAGGTAEPSDEAGVRGIVVAGPTCPVVTDPPDPDCADRPVAGAVLLVLDADGDESARVTSAADGTFSVALAPGRYRIVPQPVEGLMGTASELDVTVGMGEPMGELTIAYDTGIR
jgi:Carboxypeptidase regulatory-like domain